MKLKQMIEESLEAIRSKTDMEPIVGIILGTGLGGLTAAIETETTISYSEIPHFPKPTVESHEGRLVFGTLGGKKVVAMQGRFHYYEGYAMKQVAFPVRVMKALGIEVLVVSNAVGGMNPQMPKGTVMSIVDHINLIGDNPLIGPNDEDLGPRFPDMSEPYDCELIKLAQEVALEKGIDLGKGVLVAVAGPNLETAAEYRFLRAIGADVVGMSTVPEVIVGIHAGLRIMGLSIITDNCFPVPLEAANIEDIIETATEAEPKLNAVVTGVIERLEL